MKKGKSVQFNGTTLSPEDYLGPCIPGREIVIFGDTCNSEQILHLAKEPDVFVHEATMQNSLQASYEGGEGICTVYKLPSAFCEP